MRADCEVLVYGGTVAGIAAALGAARMGRRTILVERGRHLGGMAASGLGLIDTMREEAYGGIMAEFLGHVRDHYRGMYGEDSDQYRLTYGGYFMEPHVAEAILDDMVRAQEHLLCWTDCQLVSAILDGRTVVGSTYQNYRTGDTIQVRHKVAIDGTYEGDLAAAAGVTFSVGREARSEYKERYGGVIYYDWRPYKQEFLPESSGEASEFIQAFCFRMTLTTNPKNRLPIRKPDTYGDFYPHYKYLIDDFQSGRVRDVHDIIRLNPISNDKFALNGHHEALTSTNFAELSAQWPDADWGARDAIYQVYRDYTEGLIYFLQTDPDVPKVPRTEASRYGLPADEYVDNQNFPWQLYVRQGRRIHGEYTVSEQDSMPPEGRSRPHIHRDAIGTYEHRFDIYHARNRGTSGSIVKASDGFELLEGTVLFRNRFALVNRPATIPYRAIVPSNIDGLLVPAALSATHVAFSAIRMEPVWMCTGQAAGVAAALAIQEGVSLRSVNVNDLQQKLIRDRQVIVYFSNLATDDPAFEEVQSRSIADDYAEFDSELLLRDSARSGSRGRNRSSP